MPLHGQAFIEQALGLMDGLATIERSGVSANQYGQLGPTGKHVAADQNPNGSVARSAPHLADCSRKGIKPVLTARGQANHIEPVAPDGLDHDGIGHAMLLSNLPTRVAKQPSDHGEAKRMLFARAGRQHDAVPIGNRCR